MVLTSTINKTLDVSLDTEFDGFGGRLLSLSMCVVTDENHNPPAIHLVSKDLSVKDEWVKANVIPIINNVPLTVDTVTFATKAKLASKIVEWLDQQKRDYQVDVIRIIADWPDDIRYFCESIIIGPGEMLSGIGRVDFVMERRINTDECIKLFPNGVRHNSYWDCRAAACSWLKLNNN